MTSEQKQWIDNASYEELLSKWRFAPSGDPMFEKPNCDYYKEVMNKKRGALSHEERVATSKRVDSVRGM